ncbi:MAG TPA: SIS domain-containing protein [Actinomycetota bacterium]|nr:SIS domain-containing protein [Actinomycetota bacterium]
MSEIEREIASQPACWREAALRGRRSEVLIPTGARAAFVGCGTSLYMAQAAAGLRERSGAGETDAFAASQAPLDRPYQTVVAISRSGTTTEVVRFLREVRGPRRVAIVGVPDSPVADAADEAVDLGFADERSVVQTRFATSALAFIRAWLGEDLEPMARRAEAILGEPIPIDPTEHDHFVSLGEGWSVGLANEGALKLREAAQAWTESYPAMEFRHGPISVVHPGSVIWALGPVDPAVLEESAAAGATVVGGELDPMVELVRIQRAAATLAVARGLDPDRPRNLTRSVMLAADRREPELGTRNR